MNETVTHLYPGVFAVDGECEIVRVAEGVEPGPGPPAPTAKPSLCVGLAEADQLSALQPPAPHHRIDAVLGEDHAARLVVISREGLAVPMKVCPVQRPGWFVMLASIEAHEQ